MKGKRLLIVGAAVALAISGFAVVSANKKASPVYATESTVSWTASNGALGTDVGSGKISTGAFEWSYTRSLISGVSYSGWGYSYIQLGKNGGVENLTLSTSNIPGTIKSVSVDCGSYQGKHNVAISVGNSSYLASTAVPTWSNGGAVKTGTGTSSGEITVSFTGGTRALYIKSLSVTYEDNGGSGVTYNVSFVSNGGGDFEDREVNQGGYVSPLPEPSKSKNTTSQIRYEFAGWYTTSNFADGTEFTVSTPVEEDLVLYAKYDEIPYHIVSFVSNCDTNVPNQEIDDDKHATKPTGLSKTGYSLEGWYTTSNFADGTAFNFNTVIKNDVVLYAKWRSIVIQENGLFVKVTNINDLTNDSKYLITCDSENVALNGSLEELDVASNIVDVTFNNNHIVKDNKTQSAYFTIDVDNGYICSASEYYITNTSYANALKFYKNPASNCSNDISFDVNGNVVIERTFDSGTVSLRYNKASGDTRFRYYKTGQEAIQLYKFVEYHTVSFVTNSESVIDDVFVLDGDVVALPENPTKSSDSTYSYTFEGWYTNEGLTNPFTSSSPIVDDLTLYAKYESHLIDSPSAYFENAASFATIHGSEQESLVDKTGGITFVELGLTNGVQYLDPFNIDGGAVTITFGGGGNDGRYYDTGTGIRTYGEGYFTISCARSISKIEFTWDGSNKPNDENVASTGTYNTSTNTWTGSANEIVFTRPTGSGHWRMKSVSVTYKGVSVSVNGITIRFGGLIAKSDWNALNTRWGIDDYGILLAQKTTMNQYHPGLTIAQAHKNGERRFTDIHKGSGDVPYFDGNNYKFSAKINITASHSNVYCAAPYIVVDGEYYFLTQIEYSVNTLAQEYIGNLSYQYLSQDALTYLGSH